MADINVTLTQTTAHLERLNQNLSEMVKSTQDLVRQQSEAAESTEKLAETIDVTELELQETEEQLEKNNRGTKEQQQLYLKLRRELVATEKQMKAVNEVLKKENLSQAQRTQAQNKLTLLQDIHKRKSSEASSLLGKMGSGLGSLVTRFNLLGAAITFITGLIVGQYKTTKDYMNASAGFVEGTSLMDAQMRTTAQGLKYAMDPVEMQKMFVANRQVVNALGGTANTLKRVDAAYEEFRRGGVSSAEALQAATESLTTLRRLGIDASSDQLVKYAKDVGDLGKLFGMGREEARAYFDEITRDNEFIDLMRKTREGERNAIIESQRAFLANAAAVGMSADQAKEAARMLNKMVAAKPLDRMKQAARMQALGAAMGVSGGAEAAAAVRAGGRATAEQRQQLAEFGMNITTAADSMKAAGLGSELFAEALLDKLDPNNMFGANSPFSKTLTDQMAVDRKEVDARHKDLKADPLAKIIQKTDDTFVRLGIMSGSLMGLLQGVTGIYNYLTGGDFMGDLKVLGDMLVSPISFLIGLFQSWLARLTGVLSHLPLVGDKFKEMTNALIDKSDARFNSVFGPSTGTAAAPMSAEQAQKEGQKKADALGSAAQVSATNMQETTKRLGSTNDLLAKIHENSNRQIALAEKQLAAMTLTEVEKREGSARAALLGGTGMASSYGRLQ